MRPATWNTRSPKPRRKAAGSRGGASRSWGDQFVATAIVYSPHGKSRNPLTASCAARLREAAAEVRYVMNVYAAGLAPNGTRDLVTAIFEDFARLAREG